jgi:hypothetical protein
LDFFLWESSVQIFCPFLHWVIEFGGVYLFIYFWAGHKTLHRCVAGEDFLPFYDQPFQFWHHFCCVWSFLISHNPICQSFLLLLSHLSFIEENISRAY